MVVATSRILKDLGVKTSFFISLLPQLACCGGAGDPFWPAGPWAAPGVGAGATACPFCLCEETEICIIR